jgi:hypothetical protein
VVFGYKLELRLHIAQKFVSSRETLLSLGRIRYMNLELLIFIMHPNTWCKNIMIYMEEPKDHVMVGHELNDFLSVLMLVRVYTILRVMLNMTAFADTRAFRICRS